MLPTSSTPDRRAAMPEEWIGRLFARLFAFYGSKLSEAYKHGDLSEVKRVWAEELVDYTKEELLRGLEACRRRPWPPTLPEFLLLCRPALDPARAWAEAQLGMEARRFGQDGEWTHPAVWRAARSIGTDALISGDYRRHAARWETLLDRELARPRGEVPPAWKQITAAPPTPVDPAIARQNLDTLRAMVRGARATPTQEDKHP
jgi:hypothetical protein